MNHDDVSAMPSVCDMHPADLADRVERLPLDAAREVLKPLPAAEGAPILAELEIAKAAAILEGFQRVQTAAWLRMLSPHIVADLVFALPAARRKEVLGDLPPDQAAEVTALLRYDPDSAGGIMDNRFIAVQPDLSIEECLARLRARPDHRTQDVLYLYVTETDGRLAGVVSLRELVFAQANRRLHEIMNRDVRYLRASDDQEEIARQIQHYHFLALPVVDEKERIVGVVRLRDAIRVAENEATEDMQLMVGLSGEEHIWTPWRHAVAKRLPWLGVNLVTALGGAVVVSLFEATILRWTAVVAFLPLICAVAGNAGNQALTVVIRSFALGDFEPGDAARALRKELLIGAGNGVVLALAIGLIAFAWKGSVLLGAVAGTAMWLNQILGAVAGVAVPIGLRSCKVDPALASSILVTALTDTMGFLIFLGLAALILGLVVF